jgi:tetratricopeptide (TPR) repeat protein
MTNKSNNKRKNDASKSKDKKLTPQDEVESLQITFYEIESWIEKTTPVLTRMTRELEKASGQFEKRRKEKKEIQDKVQEPLLLLKQHEESMERKLGARTMDHDDEEDDKKKMQWTLSFQPNNMLRLDTNITSVEELIEAVKQIRVQSGWEKAGESSSDTLVKEEEELNSNTVICTSSNYYDASLEYWQAALKKRPMTCLDDWSNYNMSLNTLTKNISPNVLNYIGQVYWDCLHPKFTSDWISFWNRSSDVKRNQVCIDSGLAMVFLHIMRHHKDICPRSHDIACFYYNRARDTLMDFFDAPPDISTIEALLNLSLFCMVSKNYSQARIYIELGLRMMLEFGLNRKENLPTDDLILRKKYIKLFLVIYYNDMTTVVYSGEHSIIDDSVCNIDFYEIISINDEMQKTGNMEGQSPFEFDKTVVKDMYFAHLLELYKLVKQNLKYIGHGITKKQLTAQAAAMEQWHKKLPAVFTLQGKDYTNERHKKQEKEQQDVTLSVMDSESLYMQAAMLLDIQYQSEQLVLHKGMLMQIATLPHPRSPSVLADQEKCRSTCTNAAIKIMDAAEVITEVFGWCVCQQFISCLYQASIVFCNNARASDNAIKEQATTMIKRVMEILTANTIHYEGLPDDLRETLTDFLSKDDQDSEMKESMPPSNTRKEGFFENHSNCNTFDFKNINFGNLPSPEEDPLFTV